MKRHDPHFEMLKRNRFLLSPRRTVSPACRYPKTAAYVRKVRRQHGMSQSEFCENYDFNLRTLQGWEAGYFRPSVDAQKKLKGLRK